MWIFVLEKPEAQKLMEGKFRWEDADQLIGIRLKIINKSDETCYFYRKS